MTSHYYKTYQLKNGIRLIHRLNRSEVAHFGLIVHTGTRDEEPGGTWPGPFYGAHVLQRNPEKVCLPDYFQARKCGWEINAYTTKEETALYASFLKQDITGPWS